MSFFAFISYWGSKCPHVRDQLMGEGGMDMDAVRAALAKHTTADPDGAGLCTGTAEQLQQ